MNIKARVIASYLPQFHITPENDEWWGKGFTEWTNVGKAKPLFKGHYQPRVPADLGYYDLRVPETRLAQAEMAREYGIEGFCYWHYWFGNGKRLLERPFKEVLASGQPDFPFCLAWANESWKGFEYGVKGRNLLIEQTYRNDSDIEDHFYNALPAFKDKRYIKVDEKPLFMIFRPLDFPDNYPFLEKWQTLAIKNGLKGIYFVGQTYNMEDIKNILGLGFDATNLVRLADCFKKSNTIYDRIIRKLFKMPNVLSYKNALKYLIGSEETKDNCYPTLLPNWDHTPRTGKRGMVLHNSTPELFSVHLRMVLDTIKNKRSDHKIVFLKSWNEWAEGNYVEPDLKYGLRFLEEIKKQVVDS